MDVCYALYPQQYILLGTVSATAQVTGPEVKEAAETDSADWTKESTR
jgi:hypothetical protein